MIESVSDDEQLCGGLIPLTTQIAGHGFQGDGQRAILKRPDKKILKPVQSPPKGQNEVNFYTTIYESDDPVDVRLRQHIPDFFGVVSINVKKSLFVTEKFIVMQDVSEQYLEPSLIDIKIGSQTYGPNASESKKAQEHSKYLGTRHPFGFSVSGMIVHSLTNRGTKIKFNKSFGKGLKSNEIHLVPERFFDFDSGKVPQLIECMVKKIQAILSDFEDQRKYKMYASSLLLAYDCHAVRKCIRSEMSWEEFDQKWCDAKLIDFAYVFPSNGEEDENFLRGLRNVLALFKRCA